MAFTDSARVPRRFPSYTELARSRREAEELEEVRRAYGGTLPTKEEMQRTLRAINRMWETGKEE